MNSNKIEATELNDDQFARLLDCISTYGCENLFYDLAIRTRCIFSLPKNNTLHVNTASHLFYGWNPESDEDFSLFITFGSSKRSHFEKKQIMTGSVTDGDGLPLFATALNSNTTDCNFNEVTISLLKAVYGPEFRNNIWQPPKTLKKCEMKPQMGLK